MAEKSPAVQLQIKYTQHSRVKERENAVIRGQLLDGLKCCYAPELHIICLDYNTLHQMNCMSLILIVQPVIVQCGSSKHTHTHKPLLLLKAAPPKSKWSCSETMKWIRREAEPLEVTTPTVLLSFMSMWMLQFPTCQFPHGASCLTSTCVDHYSAHDIKTSRLLWFHCWLHRVGVSSRKHQMTLWPQLKAFNICMWCHIRLMKGAASVWKEYFEVSFVTTQTMWQKIE